MTFLTSALLAAGCAEVPSAAGPDAGPDRPDAPAAVPSPTPWIGGTPCSATKLAEIRAANTTRDFVIVDCDVALAPTDVITKRVQFVGPRSSNVRFDCNGARLSHTRDVVQIVSDRVVAADGTVSWLPVHHVTIEDCVVAGGIRLTGQGENGQADDVTTSSHTEGHTERARAAAPHHITIRDTAIIGSGRVPLYLGPGVHDSTFERLDISEGAGSLAVYFDAETTNNTLRGSYLHVASDREQLALDGSSGNRIIENRFGSITNGGIFLYRNCGEGGAVRHATPSDNLIVNNTFDATGLAPVKPAVWLASRRGTSYYCPDDNAYPFGSGLDDDDHATGNVVMQNQYVTTATPAMAAVFRSDEQGANAPNYVGANRIVAAAVPQATGCFLGPTVDDFVASGTSRVSAPTAPGCVAVRCEAGVATRRPCATQTVAFGCVTGGAAACRGDAACPAGTVPVAAQATCTVRPPPVAAPRPVTPTIRGDASRVDAPRGPCEVGGVRLPRGTRTLPGTPPDALTFRCLAAGCELHGQLSCRGATDADAADRSSR